MEQALEAGVHQQHPDRLGVELTLHQGRAQLSVRRHKLLQVVAHQNVLQAQGFKIPVELVNVEIRRQLQAAVALDLDGVLGHRQHFAVDPVLFQHDFHQSAPVQHQIHQIVLQVLGLAHLSVDGELPAQSAQIHFKMSL